VPEQLIRRLLALLAQSEAQRPASDAAVTSDSASASDEQHELHEDIVGAVEMALRSSLTARCRSCATAAR
jgi:hypothetical protein